MATLVDQSDDPEKGLAVTDKAPPPTVLAEPLHPFWKSTTFKWTVLLLLTLGVVLVLVVFGFVLNDDDDDKSSSDTTKQAFTTITELREAIANYVLAKDKAASSVANQFGYPIGTWDVSNLTYLSNLLEGLNQSEKALFNYDISAWSTSRVTTLEHMLAGALSYNQNLETWDVSSVTEMRNPFSGGETVQLATERMEHFLCRTYV